MIYLHRIAIFLFFQSSFSGIVPCEEVTWCRIMLSPSVALYVASDTHCDIWLGSRNEVSFCQTLKATKVAKFFMFPPLCSLVLEPDLDTGKKERPRNEQEMKEEPLTSSYFPYCLSEHQKTLTSSSAEPGTEPEGKHWVQHSTFAQLVGSLLYHDSLFSLAAHREARISLFKERQWDGVQQVFQGSPGKADPFVVKALQQSRHMTFCFP